MVHVTVTACMCGTKTINKRGVRGVGKWCLNALVHATVTACMCGTKTINKRVVYVAAVWDSQHVIVWKFVWKRLGNEPV
jgi:hypothetical protein